MYNMVFGSPLKKIIYVNVSSVFAGFCTTLFYSYKVHQSQPTIREFYMYKMIKSLKANVQCNRRLPAVFQGSIKGLMF